MPFLINIILILNLAFIQQTDKFSEALSYYNKKEYTKCIEISTVEIDRLSAKDSLYRKFMVLRGNVYNEIGNAEAAITDFETLRKMDPQIISNYTMLSFIYGQSGNYEKCDEMLNKGLKVSPHDFGILNNLSYYSALAGKYTEAVHYADEGLKYVKDKRSKAFLLNNRGYGLVRLNKNIEGLANINRSIQLEADNPFAYCYRAIANIQLKRWKTVCDDLKKARDLGANNLTAGLITAYCSN